MAISDNMEDLIYRVLAGEANDEEREELARWVRESEEHRAFFEAIERAWHTGKYAAKWRNVEVGDAWQAMERRYEERRRRRFTRIGWSVAAAVVLVFGVSMALWQTGQLETRGDSVPVQVAEVGRSKAVLILSTGERMVLGHGTMDSIQEAGMEIWQGDDQINYIPRRDTEGEAVVYNELVVPAGGEYRLRLADGTRVYMNAASRLRYPVNFTGDTRTVELEGEAYFEVERDERCPFVVRTGSVEVNVLGTSFNVMAYRADARTEVTLVNGKVDVRSGDVGKVLSPDHQFVLDRASGECAVRKVNVQTFVDWKNGILNFDAMPLGELSEKLGRWYDVKFFFTSEEIKRLRFSGAVKKYNDIGYILSLIEATTNVTFTVKSGVIVVNGK